MDGGREEVRAGGRGGLEGGREIEWEGREGGREGREVEREGGRSSTTLHAFALACTLRRISLRLCVL